MSGDDEITVTLSQDASSDINNFGEMKSQVSNEQSGNRNLIEIFLGKSKIPNQTTKSSTSPTLAETVPSIVAPATLDVQDPYVCDGYVYGVVKSNPKVIPNLRLEFKQNGQTIKIYEFKTNVDGNWKQDLLDLPFGNYEYSVTAVYQNLIDQKFFTVNYQPENSCKSLINKANTVRTGGSSGNYISIIGMLIVLLAFGITNYSIKVNIKPSANF